MIQPIRGQMFIGELDTGEKIELGEVKNLTNEFKISPYERFPTNTTAEISINLDTKINENLLKQIYNNAIDKGRVIEGYMDILCVRQKRKHKKKRINKKWEKRYGYEPYTKKVFANKLTITKNDYFDDIANLTMEFNEKEAVKFYGKDVVRQ